MGRRWRIGCGVSMIVALGWIVAAAARAEPSAAVKQEEKMKTYQLVFVHDSGKKNDAIPEGELSRVATARDYYEEQLVYDGVSLISGPIDDGGEIETVAVIDAETPKDAQAMFQHNPAMELGLIQLDVFPWTTAEGVLKPPAKTRERATCYLGLLKRPPQAPSYPEEELQKLQEGHLANIRKMHASGDLVAAGPVDNAGDLRGILIFRTKDPERIQKLVAEDPAVKAGRLRLELHRWNIPKGVLPEKS